MDPDEYRRLAELESDLWWFRGMERISTTLLETYGPFDGAGTGVRTVLDAGCGTGGMLRTLERYGRPIGLDAAGAALTHARAKVTGPLVQGTVERLPFDAETFDVVTSFDVVYHRQVASDSVALEEFQRVLKKEGTLLIRVPALDWLRSQHDEAVHTRQRYGKRELVDKLRAAGFDPIFVTYANTLLFPIAAVQRLGPGRHGQSSSGSGSDVRRVAPWLNRALTLVLSSEALALRHVALPIGLSLFAVARKK